MEDIAGALKQKLAEVLPFLNEKQRRVLAAAEAKSYGRGGIQTIARITGMCRQTIYRGLEDLEAGESSERIRKPGGGRKKLRNQNPELIASIEELIDPVTRGDPESPLRWTCKSLRNLEESLVQAGHSVSYRTVARILTELEYSLQANRKTSEGKKDHPDRDAQFQYINKQAKKFLRNGEPVISVDIGENTGWVNVGIDADTAEFAVESIRQWWRLMGKKRYPTATEILVCADSGGSNGYRSHLWKRELQKLSSQQGLRITVCHFPPGTSKWNKIEHRLFSYISMNWRGRPLTDYQTVVNLIASTTTKNGLIIKSRLDRKTYQRGIKVSSAELKNLKLRHHKFHGEWNYTIEPKT